MTLLRRVATIFSLIRSLISRPPVVRCDAYRSHSLHFYFKLICWKHFVFFSLHVMLLSNRYWWSKWITNTKSTWLNCTLKRKLYIDNPLLRSLRQLSQWWHRREHDFFPEITVKYRIHYFDCWYCPGMHYTNFGKRRNFHWYIHIYFEQFMPVNILIELW